MATTERTFDPVELDTVNECLWQGAHAVHLTPRAFAVLRHLADRPRRLVTKDELLRTVWAGTAVTDGVLKVCIREIRKALNEDPKLPTYIETAHRRGYRFLRELQRREGPALDLGAGPGPAARAVAAPRNELVGREQVLARLERHLERALAGERQLVFVAGPPGIGKTSVVDASLQRAGCGRALVVARGQCIEHYGAGEAYMPLLEAFGRLARGPSRARIVAWLARSAPTWLSALGLSADAPDRERLERELLGATHERMLREIAEALEELSSDVPVALVLEDLHWSDFSTLELLALLGRRRERARLLVLGTYRPLDALRSGHPLRLVLQELAAQHLREEIALERLSERDVAAYLEARFAGHAFPPELAAGLHRRTEGNPLFLVHAIAFLIEKGSIVARDDGWTFNGDLRELATILPEGIRQAIEVQIARLAGAEQTVLEAACVAGLDVSAAAVAAALEGDLLDVEERCDALAERQQFLRANGLCEFPDGSVSARYTFLHSLHASVLYHRLSPARRARCHQRVGRRGEELYGARAGEIAGELAQHFEESRDFSRAVHHLRRAAANDARRYANREAVLHLEHALALIPRLPEPECSTLTLAVLEELGLLRRSMGDITGAIAEFEALAENAEETGFKAERVRGLLYLTSALFWVDHEGCLAAADRAVGLAAELDDELLIAHARGYWGHWNLNLRAFRAEHVEACALALEVCRKADDRKLLALHVARFAYAHCLQGQYSAAIASAEEGLRLSREVGDAFDHLLCHFFCGWARLHAGRFGEMESSLTDAMAMAEKNGHRQWAALFRIELAQLHVELFEFERARELARPAVEEARRASEPTGQILMHGSIALAGAQLGLGELDGVERSLEEIRLLREDRRCRLDWILELPRLHLSSRLALARADLESAAREALELRSLATAPDEPTYLALAERTLAEIATQRGDRSAAAEHLGAAARVVARKAAPLAAWRVPADLCELERGSGRPREAEAHRARSSEVLDELIASLTSDEAARERFASHAGVRRARAVEPARRRRSRNA